MAVIYLVRLHVLLCMCCMAPGRFGRDSVKVRISQEDLMLIAQEARPFGIRTIRLLNSPSCTQARALRNLQRVYALSFHAELSKSIIITTVDIIVACQCTTNNLHGRSMLLLISVNRQLPASRNRLQKLYARCTVLVQSLRPQALTLSQTNLRPVRYKITPT